MIETIWKTSSAEQVHTKYGRNRLGGVVWQNNVKAHASSVATQDNYYWYDGLQQVTRHDRGDLTPSSGPPYTGIDPTTRQQQEDFTFDQTGNWTAFQTTSPSLAQTRTHDTANQIASLTNPSGVIQPVYDELGNMTTMPKAGDWTANISLKWDAWNRLVQFNEGSAEIAYRYDALSRRTLKENTNVPEFRHYYYDRQWRSVEERVEGATHTVDCQFVWSPIDRWTLIRRKRSTSSSLDETRFVLKDYLDPAAIIDSSAAVDERFGYDAFGQLNLMTPAFASRSSSVCDWNFLFHAEFIDSDSGLYNYGYRYYHPELGRWISRDPIQEKGGLNLFSFLHSNSLNKFDLYGLCCEEIKIQLENLKKSLQKLKEALAKNESKSKALNNTINNELADLNRISGDQDKNITDAEGVLWESGTEYAGNLIGAYSLGGGAGKALGPRGSSAAVLFALFLAGKNYLNSQIISENIELDETEVNNIRRTIREELKRIEDLRKKSNEIKKDIDNKNKEIKDKEKELEDCLKTNNP